ncbi:glycosyl transferase [Micromonospora sp. AKA38]|nr:glycosyl transferase [Micromonospora sp. AKA38]GHJ15560.1 glycosyl transferase [Micromonospora sp. AKA38]
MGVTAFVDCYAMTSPAPDTRDREPVPAGDAEVAGGDTPGPAPAAEGRPARRRWSRVDAVVALVFLLGAVWVTARGWRDPGGRLLGSRPNDQGFNEWMLAYAAHAVSHLENPFFTTLQNAPAGVNLMTNVGLQLPGLVLAPVTLLFGASFSYLLFITLNLAGTGYAWYHVLSRHLVDSRAAAFVGGLFCAFAPALVSHSNGHPHITAQWLVPFIVWRVVALSRGGHVVRDGLVLGGLVVAQFFVSLEILFLTALGCLMLVLAHLAVRPRDALRRARPMLPGLAITAVLVGVAAAYPLWMQFAGPQHRVGHPGTPDIYALKLGSYVRYATQSVAGGPTSAVGWAPNTTEQASFYGWSLLVLAAGALWWLRRDVTARVLGVVGLVSALFSIGTTWTSGTRRTDIPAPFALVQDLPVFDSVVVARFALITTVALGVLLAVAGDRLAARRDEPSGRLAARVGAVAVAAALLPVLPVPLEARGRTPVPEFVTGGAWRDHVAPGRTLVPVPVNGMTSLYWSSAAVAGFAVPEGYFLGPVSATDATGRWGVDPQPTAKLLTAVSRGERDTAVGPADIAQARTDVRYWKADAVVLPDRGARRHDDLKVVLDALYGPGRRVDDVWLWDVRPVTR